MQLRLRGSSGSCFRKLSGNDHSPCIWGPCHCYKGLPIQAQAMVTIMIARKRAETVGKAQVVATWLVKGRSLNVLTLSAGHRWNSVLFDLPFHNGSLP